MRPASNRKCRLLSSLGLCYIKMSLWLHFRLLLHLLTCVSHTTHVIDIGWTSVCPSVCTSVTCWYCVETAQPIVKLSSLHGSPMILVFCGPNIF